MNKTINVLAGQSEEINNGVAWLVNELKDVTDLVELLRDAQALSENKSVNTMCCMIVEKLDNIKNEGVANINKLVNRLDKSINDLMIELVNKKNTCRQRGVTKSENTKNQR